MSTNNFIYVLTLTSGLKIYITKQLKKTLDDEEIELKEFWKIPVEVVKVDKDGIVFGKSKERKGLCPIRIGLCVIKVICEEDIRGYFAEKHSFDHPLIFLLLEQLIFELNKLKDDPNQRKYAMLINNLLDELYLK